MSAHDPFTEGYTQALRESLPVEHRDALLAPETLARIVEDCARFRKVSRPPYDNDTKACGTSFWLRRQAGVWNHPEVYPPQTAYLGDDGKVYLREVGR